MALRDDEGLTPEIKRTGVYDLPLSAAVANKMKSGMNILNIGANVGYFSVLAAYYGAGKIATFEPDPGNFTLLQKNTEAYGSHVRCTHAAISNTEGTTNFWINPNLSGNNSLSESNTKEAATSLEVPMTTIDAYLHDYPMHVDMVIMDIEGAEVLALEGMRNTLRTDPPGIMFIEFWPYGIRNLDRDPSQIRTILHEYGYTLHHIAPTAWPDPETQWEELLLSCQNTKQGKGFCNLVALHHSGAAVRGVHT